MLNRTAVLILACCVWAGALQAQEVGSASGKGQMERIVDPKEWKTEQVAFQPRHSFAYTGTVAGMKFTWLVLTDKEPPLKSWAAAKERAEAQRLWCETEKASFVSVQLDKDWKVFAYYLCPANGAVSTQMLSTINGLDSVVLDFAVRDAKKLKGTLRTGEGACGNDDKMTYCTATGDYTFDAPVLK
jgi:hypothetical protein